MEVTSHLHSLTSLPPTERALGTLRIGLAPETLLTLQDEKKFSIARHRPTCSVLSRAQSSRNTGYATGAPDMYKVHCLWETTLDEHPVVRLRTMTGMTCWTCELLPLGSRYHHLCVKNAPLEYNRWRWEICLNKEVSHKQTKTFNPHRYRQHSIPRFYVRNAFTGLPNYAKSWPFSSAFSYR
jgi:hypothetical protein